MADGFTVSLDAHAVLAMLDRVGPSVDFHCRELGRETAQRIVAGARARVRRVTGQTAGNIHWAQTYDGKGYVALGYDKESRFERELVQRRNPRARHPQRHRQRHVDLYLEYGTRFMRKQPFFHVAAQAEAAVYPRRLADTIQGVLNDLGR